MWTVTTGFARALAGAVGVLALAASAWAQDYTVNTATAASMLETRPSGATLMTGLNSTHGNMQSIVVALSFTFPYYGKLCSTLAISTAGWVVPGAAGGFANEQSNSASHGQDSISGAFPYGTGGTASQNADGVVAVLWCPIDVADTQFESNPGYVYTWTSGVAPNRHFVVSWDSVAVYFDTNPHITIQCHLYEGSGRIVFAYSSTTAAAYNGTTYVCGLDSPSDLRYTAPLTAGRTNAGAPGSDFIFDTNTRTYTGALQYDQLVSDAGGIGNTTIGNRPIAQCPVQLQRASDGYVYVSTTTAADGSFSMTDTGLPSASSGAVVVFAQNSACSVSTSAGGLPTAWTATSSVSFAGGANLGNLTLGASADSNGDLRSAFHVARTLLADRDWAASRTTDAINRLNVAFDPASSATTSYTKAISQVPPALVIASRGASNTDAWDDAVVTKAYARHVLASITVLQSTSPDYRLDAVSELENAFAEAFGCYFSAAVSGSSLVVDGASSNAATVFDLEHPTISSRIGPDVAGRVACALYDLLDGANEPIDSVDGTSTQDRVFRLVDAFTAPPTATKFYDAWIAANYDAPGISRVYIGNGVLPDDAFEPNDARTTAAAFGAFPLRRTSLILNRFNEDWYSVTLPSAVVAPQADATFNRTVYDTGIALEIRDAGGALLATGSASAPTAPFRAATDALAAGTYFVGVRYLSGPTLSDYSLQACERLSVAAAPLRDWTVGRPYDAALGVTGGIAPYSLSAVDSSLPPGIGFYSPTQHASGTPTTAGTFAVVMQIQDYGGPINVATIRQSITIHEAVKIALPQYVGFPADRTLDAALPIGGGTPPLLVAVSSGALPAGLELDPNTLRVTGTASPGNSPVAIDAVDAAGSSDHVATRAVAAVQLAGKNAAAPLAAGSDACGWWFDAVEGSTATFVVSTAKGKPTRDLSITVLAPDRSVANGGTIKQKSGALTLSKFVCPQSGRFYAVVSSDAGDATQLLGNIKLALPKSGKTNYATFLPSKPETIEIGAIAGAKLTFKFKGDKRAGLAMKIASLLDPTGKSVPVSSVEVSAGKGGTLSTTLATGGTWTIVLASQKTSGSAGTATYSYSIKQPKKTAYSAD